MRKQEWVSECHATVTYFSHTVPFLKRIAYCHNINSFFPPMYCISGSLCLEWASALWSCGFHLQWVCCCQWEREREREGQEAPRLRGWKKWTPQLRALGETLIWAMLPPLYFTLSCCLALSLVNIPGTNLIYCEAGLCFILSPPCDWWMTGRWNGDGDL